MNTIQNIALLSLPLVASMAEVVAASDSSRPNIIFYLIEDTSPQFMALYNDGRGGQTPNLESILDDAILYNNAFSNAPVSSAARTTLITGCYAPRFGGSLHRRLEPLAMPEGLKMIPSYLRDAGYYTLNASKTDYNVELDESAWDQIKGELGDWNNRPESDQPFFMMRSNMETHESKLLFHRDRYQKVKTRTNPDDVFVHPHLPSTDLMRYTYATFYDRIESADKEFGVMLEMLRRDGLLDNTIIFFFGDNGGALPESKGYTNDVGFRVPLVVYLPEALQERAGVEVGTRSDALVSFIDFGATALNLAGIQIDEIESLQQIDGEPFLGQGEINANGRESLICYGDRFDDLYAFNRSLYRGNFRYARNYTPYHPRGLHTYYRYKSLALQQTLSMFNKGELNELQSKFFEPMGGEDLYDLNNDPNETQNLANDPRYREVLLSMRAEMASMLDGYCDLGFLPETIIYERAMANPDSYGKREKAKLSEYRKVADLQLQRWSNDLEREIVRALESDDEVVQWWGLTSGASFGASMKRCKGYKSTIAALATSHPRSFVRSRAYVARAKFGDIVSQSEVSDMLRGSRTLAEVLLVLNDMAYLHQMGLLPAIEIDVEDAPFVDAGVRARISFLKKELKYYN